MGSLGLMCMIALNDVAPLDLFALRRTFQTVAPRSAITLERRRAAPAETALLVAVDGERLAVHVAPGRIPDAEYQAALVGNLFWPEAVDAMARHRATATVCGTPRHRAPELVRAQATALTRLAAAIAAALPACGVHWVGTGAMASPERLARAAGEIARHGLPVDLWLGYETIAADRPGARPVAGARTVGAADFVGAELEIAPFEIADRLEPMRLLFAAVAGLMAAGARAGHGVAVELRGDRRGRYRLDMAGPLPGVARLQPETG